MVNNRQRIPLAPASPSSLLWVAYNGTVVEGGGTEQLNVRVSEEAYAGWEQFAADQGVTITALVEACGLALGSVTSATKLPPFMNEICAEARRITVGRRRRRRSDDA